jgi:hypothetical protein
MAVTSASRSKSRTASSSRKTNVGHLSYVGDSVLGENVNFGAGTTGFQPPPRRWQPPLDGRRRADRHRPPQVRHHRRRWRPHRHPHLHLSRPQTLARNHHPSRGNRPTRHRTSISETSKTMCGIVGYIGRADAPSVLINGLRRLEYRGYDSAGLPSSMTAASSSASRPARSPRSTTAPAAIGRRSVSPQSPWASPTPAGPPTVRPPKSTPTRISTSPATSRWSTTGSSKTTAPARPPRKQGPPLLLGNRHRGARPPDRRLRQGRLVPSGLRRAPPSGGHLRHCRAFRPRTGKNHHRPARQPHRHRRGRWRNDHRLGRRRHPRPHPARDLSG